MMSIYFPDMTDSPEIIFAKLAKKYGKIFGLKMGERWMVVLNGQELIRDALVKQSLEFAGRPKFYSRQYEYHIMPYTVADPGGAQQAPLKKNDQLYMLIFVSRFVSECFKIRLR